MGRKRLGGNLQEGSAPVLHLRVSPQLLVRLRQRAKDKGIGLSSFVRATLRAKRCNWCVLGDGEK